MRNRPVRWISRVRCARATGLSTLLIEVVWCRWPDLNQRPPAYEADALPTELHRQRRKARIVPQPDTQRTQDNLRSRTAPSVRAATANAHDDVDAGLLGTGRQRCVDL